MTKISNLSIVYVAVLSRTGIEGLQHNSSPYVADHERNSSLHGLGYPRASAGGFNSSGGQENITAAAHSDITLFEAIVFTLLSSLCICTTIVGNILVILSVFTYRPLRNVQNFFIVSLAVADLAVAMLVMPFNVTNYVIGQWTFGAVFCHMWLTFDILTCTASILNLCAIALDRYYAIHDPINYAQKRTLKRVLVSIFIVWGVSAVISIPPLIGWNNGLYNSTTKVCQLTDEQGYVIYSASGSFYIPLIIMTFVYMKIFYATRKRLRERAKAASSAKLAASLGKEPNHVTKIATDSSSGEENSPEDTAATTNAQPHNTLLNKNSNTSTKSTHSNHKHHHHSSPRKKPPARPTANSSNIQMHQFLQERQKISLSKERRAARTLGIIMGVFVLCWLPFFFMYVICAFISCAQTDMRFVNFIVWLGYINSSLNPVIYTIFNIDFRKAFKKLLQGKCHVY